MVYQHASGRFHCYATVSATVSWLWGRQPCSFVLPLSFVTKLKKMVLSCNTASCGAPAPQDSSIISSILKTSPGGDIWHSHQDSLGHPHPISGHLGTKLALLLIPTSCLCTLWEAAVVAQVVATHVSNLDGVPGTSVWCIPGWCQHLKSEPVDRRDFFLSLSNKQYKQN